MLFVCLVILLGTAAVAPVVTRGTGRNAGWLLAAPLLVAAVLLGATALPLEQTVPWIPSLDIGLSLRLNGLSLFFSMLVLVIGAGVLAYAARYLGRSGDHRTFYLLMTTFALSMLLLVLADDLVVLFVAWEATTLCSFFLIARSGENAREPAIRTLLVTAAGGLVLLAAVATMIVGTGTSRISDVLAHPIWQENQGFVTAVAVLLAIAAFTKSAQFPFQAWLPDSMVAITPVSAYLHAAAMVKAGIYLLLLFSPVLAGNTVWSVMLVACGLITALFGAAAALRRYDLKELLAYSTMSQLGLIVAMIGVGTPAAITAAVVHTGSHALFKSALFMLIGVIDHQAGTRDIRELRGKQLKMPFTGAALVLASASMAGVPLLLGFISKEMMFMAYIGLPVVLIVAAVTSVLTFAYSARIVLGAFSGSSGRVVDEAPITFWGVPAVAAVASLVFGIFPGVFDSFVSAAASDATGTAIDEHLSIWHGFNLPLLVSSIVIATGIILVVFRDRVHDIVEPMALPISGLAVVDWLRKSIIRFGGVVGSWTGTRQPALHLAIPMVCLSLIALVGVFTLDLPPQVGDPSRPTDWVLVVLMLVGVSFAVVAKTRVSAVVIVGVVGFSMTLWYWTLGAADVAITQLLVEILTVVVMVLLLRRLPKSFTKASNRRRVVAGTIAVTSGLAAAAAVWALTGRRELSDAAVYYLREGEDTTGGSNIVNTILVEFRALDTLGELTVLGAAGIAVAALLYSRKPAPVREGEFNETSAIADSAENAVFVRSVGKLLGPVIVLVSLILLFRGHNEPGGGFIAALVGGAGLALFYLAAPNDAASKIRVPFMVLIGSGIALGTATGFVGFIQGSFLAPMHTYVLGYQLSTALVFDVGVYLAVMGIVLAALNMLGGGTDKTEEAKQKEEVR